MILREMFVPPFPRAIFFFAKLQQDVIRKSNICEPWSVSRFDRFEVRPNPLAWTIDLGGGLMILPGFDDLAFQLFLVFFWGVMILPGFKDYT